MVQKEEENVPKRSRPEPDLVNITESCGPEGMNRLRQEAQRLNLFIANEDEGLRQLCLKLYGTETRTLKAEQFLQTWRRVVDLIRNQLSNVQGLDISKISDIVIQQQVVTHGFQTKERIQEAFNALVNMFMPIILD